MAWQQGLHQVQPNAPVPCLPPSASALSPEKEHVMAEITDHEADQIDQANASGRNPVVFVHGLWLLPSSWDRWRAMFEESGYATLAPGWPDDPHRADDSKQHPEV